LNDRKSRRFENEEENNDSQKYKKPDNKQGYRRGKPG
jgi:hypothetical protein